MSEPDRTRNRSLWPVLVAAVTGAILIGWIDQNAEEVQGTVILLLASTAILAFTVPRYGWLATLILGLAPQGAALASHALGVAPRFPMNPPYGGLIALIPAAIGAVVGTVVRRAVSPLPADPSRR